MDKPMHNGNHFPFAFKSEHLTKLTKHDLPVSFSPRDREMWQAIKVTYSRCLSKQLDGTECICHLDVH